MTTTERLLREIVIEIFQGFSSKPPICVNLTLCTDHLNDIEAVQSLVFLGTGKSLPL